MKMRVVSVLSVLALPPALGSCERVLGTGDGAPQPVTDIEVVSTSSSSVQLRWTQVEDGAGRPAKYIIAFGPPTISTPVSVDSAIVVAGTLIGAPSSASVEGLDRGTSYGFIIVSFRGSLDSAPVFGEPSGRVLAATDADAPGDVRDLSAALVGSNSTTLNWSAVDDGTGNPSNYALVVGTPSVDWATALPTATEVLGPSIGSTVSRIVSGLNPTTTYQFQVASVRGRLGASTILGPPSAVVSVTTTAVSASTAFFSDDFDTGSRTNANGFTWGAQSRVTVSNERAFTGTHSLRFSFGPDAIASDSHSEQRFNLGRYLSEYWVDYMLYVPTNFVHRNDPPANNKFFMTWRDTYSDLAGGTWRIGYEYETSSGNTPNSTIRAMSSRWDFNSWESSGLNHPDNYKPFIGGTGPVRVGQWNRIRLQFKAASSRTASDGIMRMWVNDALYAQKLDGKFHNFFATPADAVLRNGYFLGWSNSGFTQETLIFIDAVKFYDVNPGW